MNLPFLRHFTICVLFVVAVLTCFAPAAHAQTTFTFSNLDPRWGKNGTDNWGAGNGVYPGSNTSTNNDIARIATTGAVALNIDFGAGGNRVGNPFFLGAIDYNPAAGVNTWTFGSDGSTAATLNLNSATVNAQSNVYLYSRSATTSTWNIVPTNAGGTGAMALGLQVAAGKIITDLNNTINVSSVVTGSGGVVKQGAGTLVLSGNNTYTGATTVDAGTLFVNGIHSSSAAYTVSGGTLGGIGTINANVSIVAASLAPGNSPGRLTVNGAVTFTDTSSVFTVELNGNTAGTTYDQLTIGSSGSLNLNGATLTASLGFSPLITDKFFITDDQFSVAVNGTFNGLPEGSPITIGGFTGVISYLGNFPTLATSDGNDVVLFNFVSTAIPEPSTYILIATGLGGAAWYAKRKKWAKMKRTVKGYQPSLLQPKTPA